jgi:glycosyltransferase involved in cell wall biosynthesis
MVAAGSRVLHLAAVDHGGAGTAALRLHLAMRERGVASHMLVWESRSGATDVQAVGGRGWAALRRFAGRAWYRIASRRRYVFRDQRMSSLSRRRLAAIATETRPDLIVVHYVSDFLDFDDVAALQRLTGARVAFHPVDMGLLTGGCHYSWGCRRYRDGCGSCPALPARIGRDASARTLAQKVAATRALDHVVVVPSAQLAKDAEGAAPFANSTFRRILIGVDPARLGLLDRAAAREALGIPREGIYLLFGAQELTDPRKGMALLVDALASLAADGALDGRQVALLLVGHSGGLGALDALGLPMHRLGYVGADTLAQAYCAADFFVCPSIEDSGPMMVNEAMMSGTPVVGFQIGVLPDLVVEGKTGALADTIDCTGLTAALSRVLAWDDARRAESRETCRTHAIRHCSVDEQVRAFVNLSANRS